MERHLEPIKNNMLLSLDLKVLNGNNPRATEEGTLREVDITTVRSGVWWVEKIPILSLLQSSDLEDAMGRFYGTG